MLLKYFCLLLPFFVVVCGRSLTFVIDSTKSMDYELDVIKRGVTKFVEDVTSKKSIDEFVLVKFRDPTLGLLITNDKIEFATLIEELSPQGGGECPENSLSAIKMALEKSHDNSLLYVMTDAYANDTDKLNDIKDLCKKTGSRVSIFLSGTCVHNGVEEVSPEHLAVYKEIVKYCSGKLKVTNERGFKEAFKYEETESEYLINDIDPKEQVEDISEECCEEIPTTINDDCSKQLFYFGMPFWPMHNGESDCKPYVVSAQDVRIIQEITKHVFDEYNKRKNIIVNDCPTNIPKFKPKPKINTSCPEGPRGPIIKPEAPQTEISESWNNQVEYGASVTITCKYTGVPQPKIKWVDNENNKYHARIEKSKAQHTYISTIQLKNVTESRSYYCEAANEVGKSAATIAIEVKTKNRFEIISTPTDQTIEVYTQGHLECDADVYPEAQVTWYLNTSNIYFSKNIEIEKGKLIIRNMTTEEVGNYSCVISNENERKEFYAFVYISGLEKPTVNIELDEIKAKPGESIQVNCSTSGKPVPEVKWTYKSKDSYYDFSKLPMGMYSREGLLYTDKVKLTHQGVYRCSVENYFGYIYDDITLSIGSPPEIENSQMRNMTVIEKDRVDLECKVQSDLPVKVRWEIMKDDGSTKFNARHSTDGHYTHSFTALWDDAGTYRCIAENDAGVTEKVINVEVYVIPYIRPTDKTYLAKTGCNVTLPCVVENGNPIPTVSWEHKSYRFKSPDRVKILPSGPGNTLTLVDVHKSNQGIYTCTAINKAGYDTIDIKLTVT